MTGGTTHSEARKRGIACSCTSTTKSCFSDWFLGGSARDPQSPVDAVVEHAVMRMTLCLHHADSED